MSNKESLNPKAAKSKHLPGDTYVLYLRSLSSTWPRHPREHWAASTLIALSTFTRCSTPGALLSVVTWLLVRRSENGVWLPHCPQTSLLEEAVGSWVHVPPYRIAILGAAFALPYFKGNLYRRREQKSALWDDGIRRTQATWNSLRFAPCSSGISQIHPLHHKPSHCHPTQQGAPQSELRPWAKLWFC